MRLFVAVALLSSCLLVACGRSEQCAAGMVDNGNGCVYSQTSAYGNQYQYPNTSSYNYPYGSGYTNQYPQQQYPQQNYGYPYGY